MLLELTPVWMDRPGKLRRCMKEEIARIPFPGPTCCKKLQFRVKFRGVQGDSLGLWIRGLGLRGLGLSFGGLDLQI